MTKFAVSVHDNTILQFDSASPTRLPFVVHSGETSIDSMAFTADQQFELVTWNWEGWANAEIRRTQGMNAESVTYSLDAADLGMVWIQTVRLRTVAEGEPERVYFSTFERRNPSEPEAAKIYYVESGPSGTHIARLYATIDLAQLTVPDPCFPAEEVPLSYGGDFAFGDGNTLYLSGGDWTGLKVGVYRIDGAGPDVVTGTVQRIYLGDGPITGLCYRSPQTLYFLRNNTVCKLDVTTMSESLEGTITLPPNVWADDLAEIGNGFPAPYSLIVSRLYSQLYRSLTVAARAAWRAGARTRTQAIQPGRPAPHPDPRRIPHYGPVARMRSRAGAATPR